MQYQNRCLSKLFSRDIIPHLRQDNLTFLAMLHNDNRPFFHDRRFKDRVGEILDPFKAIGGIDEDEIECPMRVLEKPKDISCISSALIGAAERFNIGLEGAQGLLCFVNEDDVSGATTYRFQSQASTSGKKIEDLDPVEIQSV
jgi:hypothetical protein